MNRLLSPIACFTIALTGASALADSTPLDWVRRAMEADLRTTYTAIRVVSKWGDNDMGIRVRKDQAANGASATLVLAPMSMQGRVTIDDGRRWSTYNPDKKTLYVQDSPLPILDRSEFDRRASLIKQNYKCLFSRPSVIAGRKTVKVALVPHASDELFKRYFYIDAEHKVMLRVEWIHPTGVKRTITDTLSIDFPSALPPDALKLKLMETPKSVRIQAPRMERTISGLSRHVGFPVLLPLDMPFGFLFTRAESITGATRTMAALRFTDGASNLTIYQAKADRGSPPWRMNRDRGDFEHDGLVMAVDGDLPDVARAKVIEALKRNSRSSEEAYRQKAAKLFGVSEKTVGDLRDLGLGFEVALACVLVGKRDPKVIFSAAGSFRRGTSLGEIAQKFGARESEILKSVKTLWD